MVTCPARAYAVRLPDGTSIAAAARADPVLVWRAIGLSVAEAVVTGAREALAVRSASSALVISRPAFARALEDALAVMTAARSEMYEEASVVNSALRSLGASREQAPAAYVP